MGKGKQRSIAAGTIALFLVLTACSSSGGEQSTAAPSNTGSEASSASPGAQPEVTIKVFSMLANYAGDQPGWFAKLMKDKFNAKLNIIASNLAGNQQKIATMMASGDLGDLVVFGSNGQDYQDAIKAGLLLDWNKDGLLQKYGQNIMKYAGQAVDANKQQFGGGEHVYGVGHDVGVGTGPSEGADMTFGPDLRWDLYQKLGSPKIEKFEDYLPLLKKMQEMEPKSDSGKPVYGFSLWSDWDNDFLTLAKVTAQLYGYQEGDGFNPGDLILVSADKANDYQGMLDENSYYMQGLKFYFDANQMGLLDPDSLTQKFSDVQNKMKDGQVLFSLFPWVDNVYNTPDHTSKNKGFKLVPFENEKIFSYGLSPYGGVRVWAIGSKAKDPARVMQILDWLYSPEGVEEANFGPKGLTWDIKDGKPYVTDFGWKALPANAESVADQYGGGNFKDGMNQINNSTLKISSINPETGEPYDYQIWNSTLNYNADPVTKSWREAMGVLTPKEYFVKTNKIAVNTPPFTGKAPATEPSDIKQKRSEVGKAIKTYSWKMVFAKNESEYNSLKQELLKKAKGLGYDEVVKWELDQTTNTVWKAMGSK
ncbi:type 2 periplasmic-binding domain-containing protein [Paenibacillus hexagrammi]|uniref:Extracellular solute-binding protein n=1 Tax=Paenibacillus hexagrammi TaxID=2908839 RepID=A0ABY3SMB6_9BACL|nr:extracellular solute-binding protein [Paenibacillus sp. YPD9-1]UJF34864.1 extracellular solute-binding protein [Paenibacillus sp. YPD9-1]